MEIRKPLEFLNILELQKFEANGKTYFLEPHISLDRYKASLKLELEISYQTTFKKHYQSLEALYENLNKMQLVDASVKLRDTLESLRRLDDVKDHHPVLKYCALVLNTENEDRNAVDEKVIEEKIADWKAAGIPMNSFFAVVLRSVNGLLPIYRENTRDTSAKD